VAEAGRAIQHMQKALTTMNVQLANTISDISGESGQAIIRALLKGERDPYKLAKLKDYRVRASEEEIARSLEGTWQEEVLFELQQAVDGYDFCQGQIVQCDKRLQKYLAMLPDRVVTAPAGPGEEAEAGTEGEGEKQRGKRKQKARKNEPKFDLQAELTRICGVDLTSIDGVGVMTAQTFIAELGTDMSPWATEDKLVSWLKLSPNRPVTGGKVMKGKPSKTTNRASESLRMAASTLKESDSYLGAMFRQYRGRLGPKSAIKAMAAHLARLMYRMLKHGQEWVDRGAQDHEKRRAGRDKQYLERKAAALGYRLEPAA
jgi:hypothetical protein